MTKKELLKLLDQRFEEILGIGNSAKKKTK